MDRRIVRRALSGLVATLLVLNIGVSVLPAAAATPSPTTTTACGTNGTPAVVALQDTHFYIDSSSTALLFSGYAGYRINAGSAAREHLWLGLSGFTGGILSLASGQPATVPLPDLAGGASVVRYFLLTATAPSTVAQTHTVTVYTGPPGAATALCSRTFTYSDVVDTIKALANKVDSVTSTATGTAQLGDSVTVTVTGHTGTLGAGPGNDPGILEYTPNALSDFPAGAWQLQQTQLQISPDGVAPPVTYPDGLFLSGASGPDRPYTAIYTFRAIGPTTLSAQVEPIQYIASGTQVKHTDAGSSALGALPTVSAIAPLTLSKTRTAPASGVLPSGGGTASYAVTIADSGNAAGTVDSVTDTMPADASYVPGTLQLNGRTIPDPDISGQTMVVPGPLTVPAAGTATLTYSLLHGATAGVRVNSAVAQSGLVVIDGTADVGNSAPATASVDMLGSAGLNLGNDTASTAAGTPVTVNVLANDSAPSGLPLHVTAVGTPSSGTAILASDGTITYTPATGTSGTRTFSYTATDGYSTGSATVTVGVTPLAVPDRYATGKNATLSATSVLANDACTGCTVSSTLVGGPVLNSSPSGTVTMAGNGTFSYVPASNATGTVTFTYRETDAAGRTSDGQVTINVADLAPDFATTPVNTAVVVPVQANDPGCTGGCKPQAGTAAGRGTVSYSSGGTVTVTYTPTTDLWGLDGFTYGITGSTGSSTTPVTVLVGPPASTLQTTYGVAGTATLPANGSCSGCTYALGTAPAHGSAIVNSATGTSTYTPAAGFAGTDSFTYTMTDPVSGLQVSGTVNVTIGPFAADDSASTLLGSAVSGTVAGNDSCPATCTRTKLTNPASGTVVFNADGTYTYTPGSAIGTLSFSYSITSSVSGSVSSTATVHLTVLGAVDDTASTAPGTPVTVTVLANDPCTACTLTSVGTPTSGTAVISGGSVRYTPATGFTGQATFGYTLSQGSATTSATVTVTVTPSAVDDDVTTIAGSPVDVLPLANDLCANCALTGLGTPTSGTVQRSGDVVTFTPSGVGPATFTYTAVDGGGNVLTGTVTVHVVAAPTLVDDTATTPSGTPAVVAVLANDSCSGCVVSVASDPAHGSVSIDVHGQAVYQADPGFSGVDTFGYTATDPATGAYGTATVTVTVTPVAADDTAITSVNTPITVDVLANDACTGCALTLGSASPGGTPTVVDDEVSVVPDSDWSGTMTVPYTGTDPATGQTASATLTLVVSDARPDSATAAYGASVTGLDVLANDNCAGCAVTGVSTPSAGTATFQNGTVNWYPPANFGGLATFDYTAAGGGHVVSSSVRILATPPERQLAVSVNTPASIQPVPSGACPGCAVTIDAPPANGDLDYADATGFTYTPGTDFTGTDTFTYRVTDPVSGRSVESVVDVTVTAPQLAPAVAVSTTVPSTGTEPRAGDQIEWSWTVTNTGDLPLTGITATDPAGDPVSCAATSLGVGANLTCTAPHSLSQAEIDAGQVTGSLTVTAASSGGPASGSDSATAPLARVPGLDLAASATLSSDTPAAPAVGDVITVTYTVTNTGNTTLTGLGVTLAAGDALSCAAGTAVPGDQVVCTGTHTVTQADLDAGSWASTGTATGDSAGADQPLTATRSTSTDLPSATPTTTTEPVTTTEPTSTTTTEPTTTAPPTTTATSTEAPPTTTQTSTVEPTTVEPTTTVSTTTVSTEPTPNPVGTVTGVVWFDRNQNGVRDRGEWPLPGVRVALLVNAAPQHTGGVRAAASTVTTRYAITGSDGGYHFDDVAPGSYTAVASVSAPGFSYTTDTDGNADWVVGVRIAGASTAEADFAGVGKGTLDGTIFDSHTRAPISNALVSCRWAGFDDTMDTPDDVLMAVDAGGAGTFALTQLPYGQYSCTGKDPVTGNTSAPAQVSVLSGNPVLAQLPIARDGSASSTGGAVTATDAPAYPRERLAYTGVDVAALTAFGVILLVAGAGGLWLSRRRRVNR